MPLFCSFKSSTSCLRSSISRSAVERILAMRRCLDKGGNSREILIKTEYLKLNVSLINPCEYLLIILIILNNLNIYDIIKIYFIFIYYCYINYKIHATISYNYIHYLFVQRVITFLYLIIMYFSCLNPLV